MKNKKNLSGQNGNGSVVHKSVKVAPPRKKKLLPSKATNGTTHIDEPKYHDSNIDQQLNGVFDSRELLRVLTAVKNGDFTVRMPCTLSTSSDWRWASAS